MVYMLNIQTFIEAFKLLLNMCWYTNQKMCVRWGNVYSDYFGFSNGVRQGGILSPLLSIYIWMI